MMRCCQVVIPFRDGGTDPLRRANLERVLQQWGGLGFTAMVVDDGREGDAPFSRAAACNRVTTEADVIVYAGPDMLLSERQIRKAIVMAASRPGLVVPFRQYRALAPVASKMVRTHRLEPAKCATQYVLSHPPSINVMNVVSRVALDAVGWWDEALDDTAMERAFSQRVGPTRWVNGPAYHLYHEPALMASLSAPNSAGRVRR